MEKIILHNLQETKEFGKHFADGLVPGTVVALIGPLGAGKTTLTKSIAEGLGVTETITSPTFTIVCEYDTGRIPLYHFDIYRVSDPEELFEMGIEEYLHGKGICLIEWADLAPDILPKDHVTLTLEYSETENERIITIS